MPSSHGAFASFHVLPVLVKSVRAVDTISPPSTFKKKKELSSGSLPLSRDEIESLALIP